MAPPPSIQPKSAQERAAEYTTSKRSANTSPAPASAPPARPLLEQAKDVFQASAGALEETAHQGLDQAGRLAARASAFLPARKRWGTSPRAPSTPWEPRPTRPPNSAPGPLTARATLATTTLC